MKLTRMFTLGEEVKDGQCKDNTESIHGVVQGKNGINDGFYFASSSVSKLEWLFFCGDFCAAASKGLFHLPYIPG